MKPQPSVLLVDDEPEIRTSYSQALDLADRLLPSQ